MLQFSGCLITAVWCLRYAVGFVSYEVVDIVRKGEEETLVTVRPIGHNLGKPEMIMTEEELYKRCCNYRNLKDEKVDMRNNLVVISGPSGVGKDTIVKELLKRYPNHDSFSIYSDFGIRDIAGNVFEYKGACFAGLDGSFRYKNEPFPSHTQYESLQLACNLPEADVLLTHDVMLDNFEHEPAHSGLIGISYYIYKKAPIYHLHGHIHKSYEKQYDNGTKEKSVYLCEYIEI